MTDELLDIHDVARLHKVTVRTIRRWLARGDIPKPDHKRGSRKLWYPDTVMPGLWPEYARGRSDEAKT